MGTFVGGGKWREAETSLSWVEGAAFDLVEKSTRERLTVAIVGGRPPYHGDEEKEKEEEEAEELRPISFCLLRQLLLFLEGEFPAHPFLGVFRLK